MFGSLAVSDAIADGIIPHVNARKEEFIQLYQRIPLGKWLYTSFEIDYEASRGTEFARQHPWIPICLVIVYVAAIFFGKKYMDTRERFDLRYKLAFWNMLLSMFSFIGAVRTVPDLLYRIATSDSLETTVCTAAASSWGTGATGLWVQLFVFSKVPELVDTVFIVARKRPLLFLHWYHHVTVLLYCWHSYATEASQALYFVAMNYTVHAIMYGYYCLMALRLKPAWFPPVIITIAQISQMFVGVAVQIAAMVKYFSGDTSCGVNGANVFWGGMMYASYFALFMKFAIDRYSKKPVKKL